MLIKYKGRGFDRLYKTDLDCRKIKCYTPSPIESTLVVYRKEERFDRRDKNLPHL